MSTEVGAASGPARHDDRATEGCDRAGALKPTAALTAVAVAYEAVLLLGWLRPLSLRRVVANPPEGAQMVAVLGRTQAGALRFAVPAAALCALYAAALWLAPKVSARGRAAVGALAAVAVFAATLVPMFPAGTQDLFHNVADGRLLWRHGENPTRVPPAAHPEDPFFPIVFGYTDLPSAYGPLWYALDGIPTALGGDGLAGNAVAQKGFVALFFLATVVLVVVVAPPEHRLPAAVLFGWNPLLLWEFAGNGHNDAVMILFAAAAVAAALRVRRSPPQHGPPAARRWWSPAVLVFPLLALSALVKFTSLLLGPVLLLWLWRRPEVPRRQIAAGLGAAVVLCVLAYIPFYAGAATFAFLHRPGMSFILSPATLLRGTLATTLPAGAATAIAYAATGAAFATLYAALMAGLWRRRQGGGLPGAAFDVTFVYLVFASWWFWPWYLSWLAPFAAWQATTRRAWIFALATCAALVTYLYWWSDPAEASRAWFTWYALIVAGVFALPFAVWAAGWVQRRPSVCPERGRRT